MRKINKAFLRIIIGLLFLLPLAMFPKSTFAHAFGQLYTLPIPVWLYLYGGGAAILVSFVLIGFFVGQDYKKSSPSTFNISKLPFISLLTSNNTKFFLKVLSLLIFVLTIAAGYIGNHTATDNFSTLFVWIVFWLGFTYLTALFGNLWSIFNPWKIIVELFESLQGIEIKGLIYYPKSLGYCPALIFYYIFIWLELLSNGLGVRPAYLSTLILAYTFLNFSGVILLGKDVWFKYCEFFSVFFRLVSRLSPIEIKDGHLVLRPPFVKLLSGEAENFSLLLFILFMLSSTAFDGFRATTTWRKLDVMISSIAVSSGSYQISQSILLALSPLFFLILYLYAIISIKTIIKTDLSLWSLALKFAFSLIPIALAYNVAHYYTLLLVQGQSMIPVLSDPFGRGWNLFNTASYVPNIGVAGANFIWHSQVAAIIIGHVAAVYICHIISLRIFPSHRSAVLSQIPMLVLMIVYTITGLWILSQPLTLGG